MTKLKSAAKWWSLAIVSFVFAYYFWGWLGIGTFLMVALHELGHLGMAKYLGYKTRGFVFTPLGGIARIEGPILNFWHSFLIFFAGPLSGLIQALILMVINRFFDVHFLWLMTGVWAAVNLFNLLPFVPLDGGQLLWAIGNSISTRYSSMSFYLPFQVFSALAAIVIFGWWVLIWIIVLWSYIRAVIQHQKLSAHFTVKMTGRQIIFAIISYFGLVGVLVGALIASFTNYGILMSF